MKITIIENEAYLGTEDNLHLIFFKNESRKYIAKVQYDKYQNVQILDMENLQRDDLNQDKYLLFDDIDIDYLEMFSFKELLDSRLA